MRILITGHKGFIGQNIMSYLETKHEVAGYDFHPENLPLVKDYDWVIHLGAISSTTETDVDKVILHNYEFSKWLFNQCNQYNVNMQYASSASVYGNTTHFKEDRSSDPKSPYAWSKYLFDRWVTGIHPKIIFQGFRYFNVYGPHEEHKGNQASPVSKFTKEVRETGAITLFEGSDNFYRDFVCVSDVYNLAMNNNLGSGIYDIGTGSPVSFQYVADMVCLLYTSPSPRDVEESRMPSSA